MVLSHTMACISVQYERNMHPCTNYSKIKLSVKISCVLISLKYMLYEFFYTEIFQTVIAL